MLGVKEKINNDYFRLFLLTDIDRKKKLKINIKKINKKKFLILDL